MFAEKASQVRDAPKDQCDGRVSLHLYRSRRKSDRGRANCASEEEPEAGDLDTIRIKVEIDLLGYDIGPETSGISKADRVPIRHYSLLAFYRFIYQRLVERQSTS